MHNFLSPLIYNIFEDESIKYNSYHLGISTSHLFWKFCFSEVQLLATWNEVSIHTNAQCL